MAGIFLFWIGSMILFTRVLFWTCWWRAKSGRRSFANVGARRGVFLTTPNRWFPIEFHTVMPFVHWFPPSVFRGICKLRGLDVFASEDHLNLLSSSDLKELAAKAGMENFAVTSVTLIGWPSNLLLFARRLT